MDKRSWTLREYQDGDKYGIIKLFEKVWNKPMGYSESEKFWDWQFKNNPFGDLNIILGVDNDEIIGQYTVAPVPMIAYGIRFVGSLSLHTVVHPNYRGQNMFTVMAEELYQILKQKNIHLTYGFPNANSIHGFIKYLDWKEILNIPFMARPINFNKSAKMLVGEGLKSKILGNLSEKYYNLRYNFLKIPNQFEIIKINYFTKEFDILWNRVKQKIGISLIRDSKYLNWRFASKPEYNYNIVCLKKADNILGYAITYDQPYENIVITYIMDLMVEDFSSEFASYLISYCTEKAIERKSDIICSIVSKSVDLKEAYKKLGFISIGSGKLPEEKHFGVRTNTNEIKPETIFNPNNWYISLADTPGL